MSLPDAGHDPVLLDEVLRLLDPKTGETFIDCTVGRAGHSSAIAHRLGESGMLIGLDVDPKNLEYAKAALATVRCRVRLFHANFAEIEDVLAEAGLLLVDGVLADLGISTNQLFDAQYGLSFAQDMPLDMRIDPRIEQTAADLVNTMREDDLANVLYELAQERHSRRIARNIAQARKLQPIRTTERLADLVRQAIPPIRGGGPRHEKIDPATRTFMALRMAVNQELPNLDALLHQAPQHLASGGRFGVIAFHSGEDRQVKQSFRSAEQTGQFKSLTKKPLTPSVEELARNPRSRSAKLRVISKI